MKIAVIALAFLLLVRPADADPVGLQFEAYWAGFHAADFAVTLDDSGADAHDFQMATRGLTDWFLALRIQARSRPGHYRMAYRNDDRARRSWIDLPGGEAPAVRGGETLRDEENPAEVGPDKDDRDAVEPALLVDVLDPLAAFAEVRQAVARHVNQGAPAHFALSVFDGRRRFDVIGDYVGPTAKTILHQRHKAHLVRLAIKPVAGFRQKRYELWKDRVLEVFFSADGDFVPLQIDALGTGLIINLTGRCAPARPCDPRPADPEDGPDPIQPPSLD